MFSVDHGTMRSSQAGKAMTRCGKWTIDVPSTVLCALAVVLAAALRTLLHRGPREVKWAQVQGTIQDTRMVAGHALQTKWGGQLTWKAEYRVADSTAGREYALWADAGIRGDDEDGVRLLWPKSDPCCRVQYNPQSPMVSAADCR